MWRADHGHRLDASGAWLRCRGRDLVLRKARQLAGGARRSVLGPRNSAGQGAGRCDHGRFGHRGAGPRNRVDLGDQGTRARRPHLRIRIRQSGNQRTQGRRDVGNIDRPGLVLHQLEVVSPEGGRLTAQAGEQGDPEGVEVGSGIDTALDLLQRRVFVLPGKLTAGDRLIATEILGNAEIDNHRVVDPSAAQQDVVGRQIPVDHPLRMADRQTLRDPTR